MYLKCKNCIDVLSLFINRDVGYTDILCFKYCEIKSTIEMEKRIGQKLTLCLLIRGASGHMILYAVDKCEPLMYGTRTISSYRFEIRQGPEQHRY